ncbi:MAG: lipoyl(octanoyl) transferase LipB, partial [Candidatus Limnocylindrus sp.]
SKLASVDPPSTLYVMVWDRYWLGRTAYDAAHAQQRALVEARAVGAGRDTILMLEHEPVMTLGRNADRSNLLVSDAEYAAQGIAIRHVERGGEVTYHGPGQLVMYPIVSLRERGITLRQHIRALEVALIAACASFGIAAERRDGAPGCWVEDRKIGAVGVRVERGVAWHGLALNVDRDLAPFELINACGHAGVVSTSLALEQDWAATARGDRDAIGAAAPSVREVGEIVTDAYLRELAAYGVVDSLNPMGADAPVSASTSR